MKGYPCGGWDGFRPESLSRPEYVSAQYTGVRPQELGEYFEIMEQIINENFSKTESKLTHQETVNRELTAKNTDLTTQITQLNTQITTLRTYNTTLRQQLTRIEEILSDTRNKIEENTTTIIDLKAKIANIFTKIEQIVAYIPKFVKSTSSYFVSLLVAIRTGDISTIKAPKYGRLQLTSDMTDFTKLNN